MIAWRALARKLSTGAAFSLPALALWVPSGYSLAALLLLCGALIFAPVWCRHAFKRQTWLMALLLVGMGCMWFLLSLDSGAARWDKGVKWILGALCFLFASACPPRFSAFVAGLPMGCMGMGVTALWQTFITGQARATGYTNAIQWGDLALLGAVLCGACLLLYWRQRRWPWRGLMLLSVLLGLAASFLSQSRGGWLLLLLLVPLSLLLAWRWRREDLLRVTLAMGAGLAVIVLTLSLTPRFEARITQAAAEVTAYWNAGQGDSSLGVRMQQYELAADMIAQKPWTGWGAHGFVTEMNRRVQAGEYSPWMLSYPQIHNDFLDVWVKVGILGVLWQAMLFAWAGYIFLPTARRLKPFVHDARAWQDLLAVRILGCLLVLSFLVFGLSQPFFNHNSGIMSFVFYLAVLWAALQGMERRLLDDAPGGGERARQS